MDSPGNKPPILHITVVGFHHKLGCQVEFSYPPLIAGSTGKNECPSGWKYLPTLALPDGSHNFADDAVFFTLPSLTEPTESIYGVSCYRQIPVEKLKIRTADVTRSTVQKSVCILSRLPIFGYIEVKLSLIADAFFEQGDFSHTDILVKAYKQLNACLLDDESRRSLRHYYVGLSMRDIVLNWRQKALILFKLFLLQRRVIFFASPVREMCAIILGISSLIPRLLEKGFQEVACVRTSRPLSPMPDFTDSIQRETAELKQNQRKHSPIKVNTSLDNDIGDVLKTDESEICPEILPNNNDGDRSPQSTSNSESNKDLSHLGSSEDASERLKTTDRNNSLVRDSSVEAFVLSLNTLSSVNPNEYRAPLSIFASGNLCLPYLSLPYMDLLTDPSVLSYVIGTSNVLFQQKRHLADVLIDIENTNLESYDAELRRQLTLSTEDLRFMDFVLKNVLSPKTDGEGSDQWIRDQFQGYILALLRTAVIEGATKDNDHYNAQFMHAFKRTMCFQEWYDVRPEEEFFENLPAGHPFAGTLSVADMKLKISQTMQNSESGRKLNQAVNTTSRAVGGAISQAKGAFSNWWSSITTVPLAQSTNPNTSNKTDTTALSSYSALTQTMSITFQKNSHNNDCPEDHSIHIDDPKDSCSNQSSAGSANSEKLVDSAEELNENAVDENIDPSVDASLIEKVQEAEISSIASQKGIVEIGKEAELLDKSMASKTSPNCSSNLTTIRTNSSEDIFTV